LVEEYFDIIASEKILIEDTARVIVPSVRPTRSRVDVPTIAPSTADQRTAYLDKLAVLSISGRKREPTQSEVRSSPQLISALG